MKYSLPLIAALLLSGCGLDNSYYLYRNFEKNQVLTTTVGSPMTEAKVELKNNVYNNVLAAKQVELIYSGKSGNTIKIVYREYVNDLARPAFSQDLQYDLKESRVVKFKNTTIEVLEATNQDITFKVLESPSTNLRQGKVPKEEEHKVQASRN